ncbi:hypothetical protein RFI_14156 [Reticulomyxa filosa]|uniref:Sulfotransferase domain-containing protein n=1 Tax=Reticulomyxa filosa TaxID=46433 RepID=X6NAH6_RETFI|nr:hypothetical protein RFI_14156 [Reticulomyxa filosa]|eukprot:ETO23031.1 hypothetical protein RFI_14156 [Reticulomyxa filosa]
MDQNSISSLFDIKSCHGARVIGYLSFLGFITLATLATLALLLQQRQLTNETRQSYDWMSVGNEMEHPYLNRTYQEAVLSKYMQSIGKTFTDIYNSSDHLSHMLVHLGPPKSGTRTFVTQFSKIKNVHFVSPEVHYWNGINRYNCLTNWSTTKWRKYITQFKQHQQSLSELATNIIEQNHCTIRGFLAHRGVFRMKSNAGIMHAYMYIYVLRMVYAGILYLSLPWCFLIQKSPSYSRSPLIAPIFAKYLPQIRLIMVLRNPMLQMWSAAWHFSKRSCKTSLLDRKSDLSDEEMENCLLRRLHKKYYPQTITLRKVCGEYVEDTLVDEREAMGVFLFEKFVNYQIEPHVRGSVELWSNQYFFHVLFYIHSALEFNLLNQFKMIQFEWLYSDWKQHFRLLHCWFVSGQHLISNNSDDCLTVHSQYYPIHQEKHANAKSQGKPSNEMEAQFRQFYKPCTQALYKVITKYSYMFLGEWLDWGLLLKGQPLFKLTCKREGMEKKYVLQYSKYVLLANNNELLEKKKNTLCKTMNKNKKSTPFVGKRQKLQQN